MIKYKTQFLSILTSIDRKFSLIEIQPMSTSSNPKRSYNKKNNNSNTNNNLKPKARKIKNQANKLFNNSPKTLNTQI